MKRVAVILHRNIDDPSGRNEMMKSTLKLLKKKNWKIEVYLIEEKIGGNNFLRISSTLIRVFIVSIEIALSLKKGERLVLWTINAPSYLHIPGILIKIFNNKINWIAELRDALCEQPFLSRKGPATRMLNTMIEKPIVKLADKVVTIKGSNSYINFYIERYPQFPQKFEELPYLGCNKREFDDIVPQKFDKFTITYAGRLYDDWIEPDVFLKGFAHFVNRNKISSGAIQVKFYVKGWKEKYNRLINELNINHYVEVNGFVSKNKIFSIMRGSNLLLFINGAKKTREDMVHSKFYDYVASETPILLLAEKGYVISDIVNDYNLGVIAKESCYEDISSILSKAFRNYDEVIKNRRNIEYLFSREKHDLAFMKIIENLIATSAEQ